MKGCNCVCGRTNPPRPRFYALKGGELNPKGVEEAPGIIPRNRPGVLKNRQAVFKNRPVIFENYPMIFKNRLK
jgi:hypothetical protein